MCKYKVAYVGSRTTKERNANGKGLSVYHIDSKEKWHLKATYEDLINPSYMVVDHSQEFLYIVHGDYSEVSGFAIQTDGTLTKINTIKVDGYNPVHLSLSKNNQFLVIAFLESGNVVSIRRNTVTGVLVEVVSSLYIDGMNKGSISHPHQITFDCEHDRILVPCQARKKGISKIVVLHLDPESGQLTLHFDRITRMKAEARHVVFQDNGKFLYCVNEGDNTVTFYLYDQLTGVLIPMQVLPTLPETCTDNGWASGIAIHQSLSHIYVSNRTDNSISWYHIDGKTGFLTYENTVSTGGDQPRYIYIDEDQYLYVANELTGSLVRFAFDDKGGLVDRTYVTYTNNPVCVIIHRRSSLKHGSI